MIRRRSKFGNVPNRCSQGVMHQSKLEASRCNELHALQAGGLISDLEAHPQPTYRLEKNGVHICDYHPDFRYKDESGALVVEDVKGFATEVYKIKKRLMLSDGIAVEEVRRG